MGTCSVCKKSFEDEYFVLEQNKCILHCEKDYWFTLNENNEKEWDEGKVNLFWEKIQEGIISIDNNEKEVYEKNKNPEKEYTEYIDYDKPLVYKEFIFPRFQEETTNLIGTNFYTVNHNENYEVKIFQDKNLEFIDCHFLGQTDFKKYTFSKSVKFLNCNFHNNDIDFRDKVFKNSLFLKDWKVKFKKLNS